MPLLASSHDFLDSTRFEVSSMVSSPGWCGGASFPLSRPSLERVCCHDSAGRRAHARGVCAGSYQQRVKCRTGEYGHPRRASENRRGCGRKAKHSKSNLEKTDIRRAIWAVRDRSRQGRHMKEPHLLTIHVIGLLAQLSDIEAPGRALGRVSCITGKTLRSSRRFVFLEDCRRR